MRKFFAILWKTVKWTFIVFCVFILSLFFRTQQIPGEWVAGLLAYVVPENLLVHVETFSLGFRDGVHIGNLRVYDRTKPQSLEPILSARQIAVLPRERLVITEGLTYPRLPDGYYESTYAERNARVDVTLPDLPSFKLVLERPNILAVTPERVTAEISVTRSRLAAEKIELNWPDRDEPMSLTGYCTVDFNRQLVAGEVTGSAKQHHIRPLLVALDIPVAVEYMDAFTEVPGKVPATCAWKVNLVNSDFDLDLDLHPDMGKYNGVPLRHADGQIHLHTATRGTSLNYCTRIGPIAATGLKGEPLGGLIVVEGVNGTNTVTVSAKSTLAVANLLKVGGFTGDYVDEKVIGDSACELAFTFPRSMGDDLSRLCGSGHLEVTNGQIMRIKGLNGLLEHLAEHVPGVSSLTDSTQASCDYEIKNGVLSSDDIYIEGDVFSIKIYGRHNFVKDELDFTARVQFTKKDSIAGKILHPLTWPFTKLLLEFRLTGSTEKPEWHYISVLDRVLEVAK